MTTMPARLRPLPPGPPTDEQVVSEILAGATDRFAVLVQRYNQRLYRVARGVLGNDADSEDALQQSWLLAFLHLDRFRGEGSLGTWLTTIVLREARACASRRRDGVDCDPALRCPGPSPVDQSSGAELRQLLEDVLDGLPRPWRSVFVLRELEGLSVAETAEALSVSQTLVKVRMFRARRRLRARLRSAPDAAASLREAYGFAGLRCARMGAWVMARIAERGSALRAIRAGGEASF